LEQIYNRPIHTITCVVNSNTTQKILEMIAATNEMLACRNSEWKNKQHGKRNNKPQDGWHSASRL